VRISDVEVILTKVNIERAIRTAEKKISDRYYVICRIHTDEGLSGWGYSWSTPAVATVIEQNFKPLLLDEDPLNGEYLWRKMFTSFSPYGRRGVAARALGTVDVALWDLKGKVAGLPIHQLIGGYREEVPAYYSGGYYPLEYTRDAEFIGYIEEEFGKYRDKGFNAFKMKVGGGGTALDVARVKKAREVIGDEAELMIDCNLAYSPEQAIAMARKYEPYDIKWYEEPIAVDDICGLARVRSKVSMPIAIGENHATRWDFREMIEKNAADIFQGDPTLMGGITEWLKLQGLACSYGITLCPHWTHDVNVQVGAASPYVYIMEYFDMDENIFNFGVLLQNPVRARNGKISPPKAPGHGLVLDERSVERHMVR